MEQTPKLISSRYCPDENSNHYILPGPSCFLLFFNFAHDSDLAENLSTSHKGPILMDSNVYVGLRSTDSERATSDRPGRQKGMKDLPR